MSREAFEAWYVPIAMAPAAVHRKSEGDYVAATAQLAWYAWQAGATWALAQPAPTQADASSDERIDALWRDACKRDDLGARDKIRSFARAVLAEGAQADALDAARQALAEEVLEIARTGLHGDGDGVSVPTLLWAESWAQRLCGASLAPEEHGNG